MTDNTLEKRELYVFNKRGGKVVKKVEGLGRGMIGMWALQNTTKGRVSVMVLPNHEIEIIYVGDNSGFPSVKYIHKTNYFLDMDDYIVDEEHLDISRLLTNIKELGL